YLGNRSAFDVFVRYRTPTNDKGFIGIEVKYPENLRVKEARHDHRYDEVTAFSDAFANSDDPALRKPPLQQIWLDHLLALSMLQASDGWCDGFFVLLAPAGTGGARRSVAIMRNTSTPTVAHSSAWISRPSWTQSKRRPTIP